MSRSQILWLSISLPSLAICAALGFKLGRGATGILFAAAIFPDVSLIGAFANVGKLRPERVKFYNLLHTVTIPVVLTLAGCALAVLTQNFTVLLVGLAWFTHIAVDRTCGFRLRAADGSIRPDPTSQNLPL